MRSPIEINPAEHSGIYPEEVGYATQQELLAIFQQALQLQERKGRTYGDAFRKLGYMGNVARVLGKCARLQNMLWGDVQLSDADESVEDTLIDLINLAAFTLVNHRANNRWGDRS